MGIDLGALKKEIKRANMSYSDIAEKLGITRSAFSEKMSGVNDFKASQTWAIKKILNLSGEKAEQIFFTQ
ncbi:MAG TPA: toxin-antitoxin system, antitoxin component, Xre family protein [Ruminococcaceae bacterium]|nr:toxin-antitoxin system, antitoxin component, Xre family protein [Oscillospiraceae bacterium]